MISTATKHFNAAVAAKDANQRSEAISELGARETTEAVGMLAALVTTLQGKDESAFAFNQLGKLAVNGNRDAQVAIQERCGLFAVDLTASITDGGVGQSLWKQLSSHPEKLPDAVAYLSKERLIPADLATSLLKNVNKLDQDQRWPALAAVAMSSLSVPEPLKLEAVEKLSVGGIGSSRARAEQLMIIQSDIDTAPEIAEAALTTVIPHLHSSHCADLVQRYEVSTQLTDALAASVRAGKSPAPLLKIAALEDPTQRGQRDYALDTVVKLISEPGFESWNADVFTGIEEVARSRDVSPLNSARLVATLGHGGLLSLESAANTALDLVRDDSTLTNGRPAVPIEVKKAAIQALGELSANVELEHSVHWEVVSQLRAFRRSTHELSEVSAEALGRRGQRSNLFSAAVDFGKRWRSILSSA